MKDNFDIFKPERTHKIIKDSNGHCLEIWVNDLIRFKFEYDELGNLTKTEQFHYEKPNKTLSDVLDLKDFDFL